MKTYIDFMSAGDSEERQNLQEALVQVISFTSKVYRGCHEHARAHGSVQKAQSLGEEAEEC